MESGAPKRKFREVNKNVPLPSRENATKKVKRSSNENAKIYQKDVESVTKRKDNLVERTVCDEKINLRTCDDKDKLSTCDRNFKPNDKLATCDHDDVLILPVKSGSKVLEVSYVSIDSDSEETEYESDSDSDSTFKATDEDSSSETDSTLKSCQEFTDDEDSTRDTITESSVSEASVKTESIVSDAESKELNLWFSDQYIEDIILNELKKESQYSISDNYCEQYDINPARREVLVDWMIGVHRQIKAGNAMIHLAVILLDILLDRMYVPVDEMQAAAVAAFWVAFKYVHGTMEVKTMLDVCAGNVTKEMILRYEMLVILKSNSIQIGGDVLVFFNYFLHKIYGCIFPHEIYYCGQYLLEVMLLHYDFVYCLSSERAATALVATQEIFPSNATVRNLNLHKFIDKKRLDMMSRYILSIIKKMYSNGEESEKYLTDNSVYAKYKSSKYYRISTHQNFKKLVTK